jgi:hypothetical protein
MERRSPWAFAWKRAIRAFAERTESVTFAERRRHLGDLRGASGVGLQHRRARSRHILLEDAHVTAGGEACTRRQRERDGCEPKCETSHCDLLATCWRFAPR